MPGKMPQTDSSGCSDRIRFNLRFERDSQISNFYGCEEWQRNLAAIEWLKKWSQEGDEEEQRETFEYLQKALNIK